MHSDVENEVPDSDHASGEEPQKSKAFWKKKRWWALGIGLLLLYPIAATVALWSGLVEHVLKSEDLRVTIAKPAYSIIPGDFHLERVEVYMNGDSQFTLFGDDIHARVDILPLFQRTFSLSWLSAENVKFRMRFQQEKGAEKAPRAAAFPPLPGLPGVNTKSAEKAEESEEREASWKVHLEDLKVGVTELWFFEYRYLGEGTLRGGFERGSDILQIDTSVQKLGPGKLLYGEKHVISHNFRGQVQAEIPQVNPSDHADLSFLDFVNADIDLKADIENLEHLTNYLPQGEIKKGAGHLTVHGVLKQGALSSDTEVAYQSEQLEFRTSSITVNTDIDFLITVAAAEDTKEEPNKNARKELVPRLYSHSKNTALTFSSKEMKPFTLEIRDHTEKAALDSTKLGEEMKISSASVELPSIVSKDLENVESLSESMPQSGAGEAEASLHMKMDEEGRFHGPFSAQLKGLELEVPPVKMSLDAALKFQASVDLAHETLMLSGIEADATHTDFLIGDNKIEDWWLKLRGKKLWVDWAHEQVTAEATLAARDAEPVIRAVAHDQGGIPAIVADVLKFPNVRAAAQVRRDRETFDLMLESIETAIIDFSGRVYRKEENLKLALLIGGKVLSLGLYKDPKDTSLVPMARTSWLNKKLETFPAPKERVAAPKP